MVVHKDVMTVPHSSHPFFVFRNAAASALPHRRRTHHRALVSIFLCVAAENDYGLGSCEHAWVSICYIIWCHKCSSKC